jgi:transcriptional regulator with XRE-family HTH domain
MSVDQSVARLLAAAIRATAGSDMPVTDYQTLREALGRVSPAALTNWKSRGVPRKYALEAEKLFGVSARHILEGVTDASLDRTTAGPHPSSQGLGERMRIARLEANLTQQQVADALEVNHSAISQYEHGRHTPTLQMLNAFCDLTRVDLGWLARGEEGDGVAAESTQPSPDLPGLTGFGERWKQARVTAGLSQEQVAHALDVSRVSVSHYESGRNEPGLEALIRFSAITRTSVEWLVLGTESSIPRQGDLPKALETYLRQTTALVDAVRPLVSDAFVQPPAVENYVQFAQYLVTLSKK